MLKVSNLFNENADLILIRGLPGSGKSTLAAKMHRAHFEADAFFEQNPKGEYRFDATKLGAAHKWCQKSTEEALRQGRKVVVANTFTQMKELKPYLDMAQRLGCTVSVMEAKGNYQNVHGVPEEALRRMAARWEQLPGPESNAAPSDINSKYLAFQISPSSRANLLQVFPPKYPRVVCDHVTVDFGVNKENFSTLMETYSQAELEVIGFADDARGASPCRGCQWECEAPVWWHVPYHAISGT